MTIKIKNWDEYYENNRTRSLKTMQWVPLPNSHDGDGYTQLISEKNGMALFGAWVLIVQVASKCHPRGTLVRGSKKPHDYASLARMTRGDEKTFQQAFKILLEIGWIEEIEPKTAKRQEGAGIPHEGAGIPQVSDYGMEGMEGNGRNGKRGVESRSQTFHDELAKYVEEYGKEVVSAFFQYWSEPNPSKTKMRFELEKTWDAKRRLGTWARREKNFNKGTSNVKSFQERADDDYRECKKSILDDRRKIQALGDNKNQPPGNLLTSEPGGTQGQAGGPGDDMGGGPAEDNNVFAEQEFLDSQEEQQDPEDSLAQDGSGCF